VESRASSVSRSGSCVSSAGGLGAGRPIKVAARGRMGRTLPSGCAFASGGRTDAVGEVAGSGGGATEAVGEVGGSEPTAECVNCTRIGCCITRVTSFESSAAQSGAVALESSAPQSVSMSSVDGGVDGSAAGASLVGRGGTEDDNP
jgi:hypothetical protein